MALLRSSHPINVLPDNTLRRKLQSRRERSSRRRVFTVSNSFPQPTSSSHGSVASSASSPTSSRAILVPLQFNLRRLPSRLFSGQKEEMRDVVQVGTKRKRTVSGSENAQSNGRTSRIGSRVKRRRAMPNSTSDEEPESIMDIDDGSSRWDVSDHSDDDDGLDSSENYFIHEATARQLLRLRKDALVRLYVAAGLTDDAELFTKPEIVDCIMAARDDLASLPPSSPPGVADSNSSDYSSDGGNMAGGEETDFGHKYTNGLKRRATVQDLGQSGRRTTAADRCFSMGDIDNQHYYSKTRIVNVGQPKDLTQVNPRRRAASNASSSRSSPATSSMMMLPSPPATRSRARRISSEDSVQSMPSSKAKGKGKQVEFSDDVKFNVAEPPPADLDQESDLTDLTEVEESLASSARSPKRLRSSNKADKDRTSSRNEKERVPDVFDAEPGRRITPMRKAKGKMGSLKEEDTEEEDELEDEVEEEVDELDSSLTATPKASAQRRQTPLKRRLRPRPLQTLTPPSDGDDERSDEGSVDAEGSMDADEADDEETIHEGSEGEEGEEAPASKPRTLRNGKVVGDDDDDAEATEEDEDALDESPDQDAGSIDLEAEGDTEESEETDEPMDDDIDLTVATAKTLIRLRRDDLVRLCETRDLEVCGTKPQLAEALLQWRDKHSSETASSPSSTGTARPPYTARPRGRRTSRQSGSRSPPVLLRSERVHLDEPRTPPVSGRPAEPELELDLESLGLEDREIPPDKLTKQEKIGSGGFKDVFIGRFKGRKVAIAEFRGQLSAMDIKELKLLGDFDHPNIVRFLGVSIPENTRETPVMIVSELCSNGDLFDYVRNVNPPTLYRVLCIMLDIARGLEYLHTRKPSVIHRDCKSSNILITSKGVAKITDFGLAKVKQSTRSMVRSLVGTVNWQAPELWHAHPKYNHKVDVFSCAMVYWEILQWHIPNKKFPWEGMNEHAIYDLVGAKHQRPSIRGLRDRWCPEIVDLIERMWAQDHQDRPTMSEVVEEVQRLTQAYR